MINTGVYPSEQCSKCFNPCGNKFRKDSIYFDPWFACDMSCKNITVEEIKDGKNFLYFEDYQDCLADTCSS